MAQGVASAKSNYRSRRYCQWADRLDEQFADAEYLVEQGQAFFDSKNLERVKGIRLSKYSARLVRSSRLKPSRACWPTESEATTPSFRELMR